MAVRTPLEAHGFRSARPVRGSPQQHKLPENTRTNEKRELAQQSTLTFIGEAQRWGFAGGGVFPLEIWKSENQT